MDEKVLDNDALHAAILDGMQQSVEAAKLTLGPTGRNTIVDEQPRRVDPLENIGAQMVREVASNTFKVAGDGTSTAMILAQAIYRGAVQAIADGDDQVALERGIDKTVKAIVGVRDKHGVLRGGALELFSSPVWNDMVLQIATHNAHSDTQIGGIITEAIFRVGKDGVILVEDSRSLETRIISVEGMQFEGGYASPYFITDAGRTDAVLDDPYLLLYAGTIPPFQNLRPLLDQVARTRRPLLILPLNLEPETLAMLVVNKLRGIMSVAVVKAPAGEGGEELLRDVAALTRGRVIRHQPANALEDVVISDLGEASRVVITRDNTTILEGAGRSEDIAPHTEQISSQNLGTAPDVEREVRLKRVKALPDEIAVIQVGAATEIEMDERRAQVEYALRTTRAAIAEGVVPGGGVALVRCLATVDRVLAGLEGAEKQGAEIVSKAIQQPLIQIAQNAGLDGPTVLDRVLEHANLFFGFNAQTGLFEDLRVAGILDSLKVVRTALANASDAASQMLNVAASLGQASEGEARAVLPSTGKIIPEPPKEEFNPYKKVSLVVDKYFGAPAREERWALADEWSAGAPPDTRGSFLEHPSSGESVPIADHDGFADHRSDGGGSSEDFVYRNDAYVGDAEEGESSADQTSDEDESNGSSDAPSFGAGPDPAPERPPEAPPVESQPPPPPESGSQPTVGSPEPQPPSKAPPASEPGRYTDVAVYNGCVFAADLPQATKLADDVPLVANREYTLEVAIRLHRVGVDAARPAPHPVLSPRQNTENLVVYVLAQPSWSGIKIAEPFAPIIWPFDHDSDSAVFHLDVKDATSDVCQGSIDVRLYSAKLDLLDLVRIELTVVRKSNVLQSVPPRSLTWGEEEQGPLEIQPSSPTRALSIHVRPIFQGYELTFLLPASDGTQIEIPVTRSLSKDDLGVLLTRVRDFWTELSIKSYATRLTVSQPTFNLYLQRLRDLGCQAWTLLFGDRFGDQQGASETLGGLLAATPLADGSIVQITYEAAINDFVFPWSILVPPGEDTDTVDISQFWGVRYQIEQVTKGPREEQLTQEPISVIFALDPGFGSSAGQQQIFDDYQAASPGRVSVTKPISTEADLFIELKRNPAAHLLYFYCHGYTSAGGGPLRPDGVQQLKQCIESLPEESPERKAQETLFNLLTRMGDESWIFIGSSEIRESRLRQQPFFQKPKRPIVFLNMCQSAALMPSISTGFARLFLDHSASAVVGTESPITSVFADAFGKFVLDELFAGASVGAALFNARRYFIGKDQRNPLGLAYTLYGRGTAKLGLGPILPAARPSALDNITLNQ
jgi:chaperonin GroEL